MAAGKKVCMVFTNHDKLGDTGKPTGWYLPEAAHPYKVFKDAGLEITFASPKGGAAPLDPGSVEASKDDAGCVSFNADTNIKAKLENTVPLADVKSADYDAVFFVGGFGTMWDFPDDANVQRVSKEIYENGGVVSAVCHGPVALLNVKLSDGSPLMAGRDVTAFTNAEEDAVQCRSVVPYTCEDKYNAMGAKFSDGGVFKPNVKVSGRVITGQNPPSADPCAKEVVSALSPSYTIYYHGACKGFTGRAYSPMLLLEHAGASYDIKTPDAIPGGSTTFAPPMITTPDGTTFAQTHAICHMLGKSFGLCPGDAGGEAKSLQLNLDFADCLVDIMGKKGKDRVMKWVSHFESALGEQQFFGGGAPSYVDYVGLGIFAVFPLKQAKGSEDFAGIEMTPKIKAWYDRMQNLACVKKVNAVAPVLPDQFL